jgi:hypothetical protein
MLRREEGAGRGISIYPLSKFSVPFRLFRFFSLFLFRLAFLIFSIVE